MAYDFSFTIKKVIVDNRRLLRINLTETDVQIGSEALISDLPRYGTIVRYQATLTPSAATVLDPGIGDSASWTANSQTEVSQNQTAAEHIDNTNFVRYFSDAGELYVRNTPDVNGDSIATEFLILEGWDL